ncbi:MAG TPA: hypothetical protein VLC07_06480 [Solirubrobacterales bacterium]|nr:hypothetical protein [Solirubrobacterales bacterium]
MSAAGAETVVPPGNGAATQYTEAFPTSGGNAVSGDGIKGGNGHASTPSHVLGSDNAKQLEGQGQIGRETARAAAETAPPQGSADSAAGGGHSSTATSGGGSAQTGGKSGGGSNASGGSSPQDQAASGNLGQNQAASDSGNGSSGLGEVIGQATGSSSGESGLLLPLILVAAVIASFAYAWRRRRVAH